MFGSEAKRPVSVTSFFVSLPVLKESVRRTEIRRREGVGEYKWTDGEMNRCTDKWTAR